MQLVHDSADLPLFLMLKPLKDPKMRTQALLKVLCCEVAVMDRASGELTAVF